MGLVHEYHKNQPFIHVGKYIYRHGWYGDELLEICKSYTTQLYIFTGQIIATKTPVGHPKFGDLGRESPSNAAQSSEV